MQLTLKPPLDSSFTALYLNAPCILILRYFVTLAGLTAAVKQGVLGKTDEERAEAIEKVAEKLEPYIPAMAIDSIRSSPNVGAFAVAWVAAKFTEPIRLVATFFIVPRIARYLGRAPAKIIKDVTSK